MRFSSQRLSVSVLFSVSLFKEMEVDALEYCVLDHSSSSFMLRILSRFWKRLSWWRARSFMLLALLNCCNFGKSYFAWKVSYCWKTWNCLSFTIGFTDSRFGGEKGQEKSFWSFRTFIGSCFALFWRTGGLNCYKLFFFLQKISRISFSAWMEACRSLSMGSSSRCLACRGFKIAFEMLYSRGLTPCFLASFEAGLPTDCPLFKLKFEFHEFYLFEFPLCFPMHRFRSCFWFFQHKLSVISWPMSSCSWSACLMGGSFKPVSLRCRSGEEKRGFPDIW